MRILALDYGRKRVGVALTDPLAIIAQPLPFMAMHKEIITDIIGLIQDKQVAKIIVGLPLTMKGTDSEMTQEARDFARSIEQACSVPVVLYDERCTSSSANDALLQGNVSRQKRKQLVDSIAASILLQAYLEEHGS
ncbi:MAG: Holliday junction resolvase RuvX [Deltaproteobacteria bacterium]|nr:Holliday junction resolvase RuvX [Deltaproteobacteria bacterium]